MPDSSRPQEPDEEVADNRSGDRAPERDLQECERKFFERLNFRPKEWSAGRSYFRSVFAWCFLNRIDHNHFHRSFSGVSIRPIFS